MRPQLTLEAFADWCEKQPAEKGYNFLSLSNCACAQYAGHLGVEWLCSPDRDFWLDVNDIAGDRNNRAGWTFGALASRLRSADRSAL